ITQKYNCLIWRKTDHFMQKDPKSERFTAFRVCAAVGLADLMSAFFALMSLHKYLCFNGSKIKEHGITILGVCCAAEVVFAINERKFSNFVWLHLLLLVSGCVVTVSFRCYLMNFEAPIFQEVDNPASFLESLLFRLLNYNYIYVLNAWIIIHPLWLCFDWSMGCVPLITSFLDLRLLSVFCFWFLFFTLIYQSFYSKNATIRSLLQFCIIFIVIPFVPSSNLFFVVGFVVAERSLYLSSVGFCLLTVTGCLLLSSLKHPALVVFNFDWLTEERLFSSGISVCPLNAKVHYNIAKLAADKGNKTLAVLEYKESLKLNSKYYHAMNNLANILKDLNQT
ncbi:transmembrane and TPR repeat-containing protein 4-like protein, partial [Leptotrombidium deliense]